MRRQSWQRKMAALTKRSDSALSKVPRSKSVSDEEDDSIKVENQASDGLHERSEQGLKLPKRYKALPVYDELQEYMLDHGLQIMREFADYLRGRAGKPATNFSKKQRHNLLLGHDHVGSARKKRNLSDQLLYKRRRKKKLRS